MSRWLFLMLAFSGNRLVRFGSCRPRYAIPVSVELCLHPIDQKTFDLPAKVLTVLGAFSLVRVIINGEGQEFDWLGGPIDNPALGAKE